MFVSCFSRDEEGFFSSSLVFFLFCSVSCPLSLASSSLSRVWMGRNSRLGVVIEVIIGKDGSRVVPRG